MASLHVPGDAAIAYGGAEGVLERWGPWAIIVGRQVPGMRIVLSELAGILEVPYRVSILCVLVSASIFIELDRRQGPRVRDLFTLFPTHLLPWVVVGLILPAIGYLGYEHGYKPKDHRAYVEPH